MSDRHEAYLVELFDGLAMPGSGNQWNRPTDGRQSRYERNFAFAWDGKSTMARSITVDLDMIDKLVEQAGAERPMLPVRWYLNDRLTESVDWVMISADDMAELLEAANR